MERYHTGTCKRIGLVKYSLHARSFGHHHCLHSIKTRFNHAVVRRALCVPFLSGCYVFIFKRRSTRWNDVIVCEYPGCRGHKADTIRRCCFDFNMHLLITCLRNLEMSTLEKYSQIIRIDNNNHATKVFSYVQNNRPCLFRRWMAYVVGYWLPGGAKAGFIWFPW